MWLHFNKFDELTGYSLPVWVFVPAFVIMLALAFFLWPIVAFLWALGCFDKGQKFNGWALLLSIPFWIFQVISHL